MTLGKPGTNMPDTSVQFGSSDPLVAPDTVGNSPTADFAVEAWVKPGTIGTEQHIVSKYGHYSTSGGANDQFDGYSLRMTASGQLVLSVGNATGATTVNSNVRLQAGRWYHVVGTLSSINAQLFVNGSLERRARQAGHQPA